MDPTKDVQSSGTASEQQGDISNPRAEEEEKARVLWSLVRAEDRRIELPGRS